MDKNLNITITVTINAHAAEVWDALTNPEKIRMYLFGTETLTDWKVGSPIVFQGEYQGQQYRDHGIIVAFEPEKWVQYTYWSSFSGLEDKPENYSKVGFRLESAGNNTTLTLTQEGFANEQTRDHSKQNWTMVLEEIKKIVSG